MDLDKLLNNVCNSIRKMGEDAERKMGEAENKVRKELRSYSDEKIKHMYQNKHKLKERGRELVEEEAKRRGICR